MGMLQDYFKYKKKKKHFIPATGYTGTFWIRYVVFRSISPSFSQSIGQMLTNILELGSILLGSWGEAV